VKYEIDTIPVWDALRSGEECPFCLLEKKSQDKFLRFYLGDSVMVPEIRVQVNEKGFSADYYEMLARDANKQGLALITHTHLKDMRRQQESLLKTLVKESARLESQKGLKTLTASSANLKKVLQRYRQYLQRRWDSCMIGPQVEEDLNRYAFTLLHLFRILFSFRSVAEHPQFRVRRPRVPGQRFQRSTGMRGSVVHKQQDRRGVKAHVCLSLTFPPPRSRRKSCLSSPVSNPPPF